MTGLYSGALGRICPSAKPKVNAFACTARASRDDGNGATEIRCNASEGPVEAVNIFMKRLPSGKVRVTISGAVTSRTTGQRIPINATGVGNGRRSSGVSLSTRIPNGHIGAQSATIDAFAISSNLANGKTQLYVEVAIYPRGRHPLGAFTAAFKGTMPTPMM